ncbi:MAG: hypothetical protein SGARI_002385 [Bacillariaceae sp.]
MNPTHVLQQPVADANNNHPHDEEAEWPTVNPEAAKNTSVDSDDWELLPEDANGNIEVTTATQRSPTVVRIVEPAGARGNKLPANLHELKHCSSSPDFRHLVLEESESEEDDSSAVLVDSNDISVASSSVVVVQAPPPKTSVWGGGVSFKDTLLKDGAVEKPKEEPKPPPRHYHHKHHHKKRVKKQSTFVVKPIPRSAKSTGDLQKLALIAENEGEILGATDAEEYYMQKATGVISKKNGLKMRPDERVRLKMINKRKNDQRRAQGIDVPEDDE